MDLKEDGKDKEDGESQVFFKQLDGLKRMRKKE